MSDTLSGKKKYISLGVGILVEEHWANLFILCCVKLCIFKIKYSVSCLNAIHVECNPWTLLHRFFSGRAKQTTIYLSLECDAIRRKNSREKIKSFFFFFRLQTIAYSDSQTNDSYEPVLFSKSKTHRCSQIMNCFFSVKNK